VAAGEPALRIVAMTPFTLVGAHFRPGERVRLVVASDRDERVQKVRANAAGAFEVVFDDVRTGRMVAELSVTAEGEGGRRISFALNQPQRGPRGLGI
jgi:hypothetical protein